MSMSSEYLHDIVGTTSLIEPFHKTFWQKYVPGINLTYYDCPEYECLQPVAKNEIRVLGHYKHIEFVRISDDSSIYYSSLIVPIFKQLAERFNLTVQLYISKRDEDVDQQSSIATNRCTATDRVPYIYEFDNKFNSTICATPLFMINQLQILSAKIEIQRLVSDVFHVFSINIWLIILLFYLICIVLEYVNKVWLFSNKQNRMNQLWSIVINYFNVLLAKESQNNTYKRSLYIFWVLGCIPLVEIFRNDMIAKIANSEYRTINTIEQLLDTNMKMLATAGDITIWRHTKTLDFDGKVNVRNKQLFNRTEKMLFNDPKWLEVLNSPRQLIKMMRTHAILEDESAILFFARILEKFMPIHLSQEAYFPQFISPICHYDKFPYKNELWKLTRELFENGLLFFWNIQKHDYYSRFGRGLFKVLAGDDVFDRLNIESEDIEQKQSMGNLFQYIIILYLVIFIINFVTFLLEIIYYVMDRKFDNQLKLSINDHVVSFRSDSTLTIVHSSAHSI